MREEESVAYQESPGQTGRLGRSVSLSVHIEDRRLIFQKLLSVSVGTDFQKLMYTDFIHWLIFSGHWFLKISVNRYTLIFKNWCTLISLTG